MFFFINSGQLSCHLKENHIAATAVFGMQCQLSTTQCFFLMKAKQLCLLLFLTGLSVKVDSLVSVGLQSFVLDFI